MPILSILISTFVGRLLTAIFSQAMLEKVFFDLLRYLASKTDTPIDDEYVEKLYESFQEAKTK